MKHLNENSTIQHRICRHWSLIVKICWDNAVQDLTLVSMVKAPLISKRGRKGGAFVGEYIVIDYATRICCQQIWVVFACWYLMTNTFDFLRGSDRDALNNFRSVLCSVAVKASS